MRIIFFCVVLINIVFFIWEYRKGAPEIYLPPDYENNLRSDRYQQKILLLPESNELQSARNANEIPTQHITVTSEAGNETLLRETEPYSIDNYSTGRQLGSVKVADILLTESGADVKALSDKLNSQISPIRMTLPSQRDTKSVITNNSLEQLEADFTVEKSLKQIIACYQLIKGEYTQNTLAKKSGVYAYKLDLFEQQQLDENSYLVLTLAANSTEEAIKNERELKQQGIKDLWLFREGLFQWRISLGLFSGKEQAEKAQDQFSERTNQELEIVPSYLKKTVTIVKITTDDQQEIATFEKKIAMIVNQKLDCDQLKNE